MRTLAGAAGPLAVLLQTTPAPSATPALFGANVISFSFLLSVIVWAPAAWALVLAVAPNPRGRNDRFFYGSSFWVLAAVLALTVIGYMQFASFQSGPQFEEEQPWLPAFGINYHLGADGISIVVLLLNGLVGVAAVLASSGVRVRPREYFVLLLCAETAVNGLVCARDVFMLFLFFAAEAVPLALLAGGWAARRGRRPSASLLGYWGAGTLALLLAIVLMERGAGGHGFEFNYLSSASLPHRVQIVSAVLLVIAAATRLPLFPLHGWVGDVLSEAPAGVAVMVAGASSRAGAYVLLRLLDASMSDATKLLGPFIAVLAGVTVVYAALAALLARDLRRAGAYLAIVPGGLTVLGLAGVTPLSIIGASISLFTGGMAAALIVGACALVAERAQTRELALLGGLGGRAPRLTWLMILAGVGVIGLPFTGTFVADLMIFFGSFGASALGAITAAAGLVITAGVVGWLLHRVVFGAPNPDAPRPSQPDAPLTETWALALLAGALLWVGLLPGGPKLAGVPVFDPGMVNVINGTTGDLASAYVPPAPPVRGG